MTWLRTPQPCLVPARGHKRCGRVVVVLVVVVVPLVLTAGSPLTAAVAVGGLQLIAHAFHHLHALPVTVVRVHGVSEDSGWMISAFSHQKTWFEIRVSTAANWLPRIREGNTVMIALSHFQLNP